MALAVVGLTIYKFTFNSDDALPGASRVADEQVLSGVEGIVKGYLKGNRVVVFSKVETDICCWRNYTPAFLFLLD